MSDGRLAWALLAALLGIVAVAGFALGPAALLQWQPERALGEPWRAWTAVGVHFSAWHLVANLAGLAVLGAWGVIARLRRGAALAWLLSWPLAQSALLLRPDLPAYGGLSGVLHAGVAVAAINLLVDGDRRQRWIGAAVLAGLAVKIVGESPGGAALRHVAGADIAVAPFAHAGGALAGLACAIVVRAVTRWRDGRTDTIAPHG